MSDEIIICQGVQSNSVCCTSTRKHIISFKWIYKVKYKVDGSLDMYKTCLVAKGYTNKLELISWTRKVQCCESTLISGSSEKIIHDPIRSTMLYWILTYLKKHQLVDLLSKALQANQFPILCICCPSWLVV